MLQLLGGVFPPSPKFFWPTLYVFWRNAHKQFALLVLYVGGNSKIPCTTQEEQIKARTVSLARMAVKGVLTQTSGSSRLFPKKNGYQFTSFMAKLRRSHRGVYIYTGAVWWHFCLCIISPQTIKTSGGAWFQGLRHCSFQSVAWVPLRPLMI